MRSSQRVSKYARDKLILLRLDCPIISLGSVSNLHIGRVSQLFLANAVGEDAGVLGHILFPACKAHSSAAGSSVQDLVGHR